jgi:alpha-amylase/alpha-mannosidase (GH57 family)
VVKLAILWHMHQPYYEDLATGEHILPWVRLHAIKDYYGMVSMLEEFPQVRVTFNLVPSLLVQIQAFAEDRARDRHLAVGLKPAEELTADEGAFLVANGFHASFERMIRPYPRYAELQRRLQARDPFSVDDLRDLQVWHKLAWMDADWLVRDARLAALVQKGSRFSESDKHTLREVELDLLRRVIPAYHLASTRGQVELSTSPFYHPILPLLCDTDVHLHAHPHSPLPRGLFRAPQDGAAQLQRAFARHIALFGEPPHGVWPSEGSVSNEAIGLIAETGCAWTATDEGILARSLNRSVTAESLYRPYRIGPAEKSLTCLFRDHALSDLIGFSYQSWSPDAAADDFVRRVRDAGQRFAAEGGEGDAVVSVILDGENAWEHYDGGGRPFLRALYTRLEQARDIGTVTMAEAASAPARRLDAVFPGSWINSDFYIWAGHGDDHHAWTQLAEARQAFEQHAPRAAEPDRVRATEELLIAEGSDWFWWYGDDHSSEHDREFDDLFRRHLRNVYRALGLAVPDALYMSNITTDVRRGPLRPATLNQPVVDGEVTSFADWVGALPVPLGAGGRTMHRFASELVHAIWIGVGTSDIYLRVDGTALIDGLHAGRLGVALLLSGPSPRRFDLLPSNGAAHAAFSTIVEARLAFDQLSARAGDRVGLTVLVTDAAGQVVEQHPAGDPIEIELADGRVDLLNWVV